MKQKDKFLKAFEMHGTHFINETDTQLQGDCPFCQKPKHFYVNKKSYLWDCKVCSLTGNYSSFLNAVHKRNTDNIQHRDIVHLSKERGLPVSAFSNTGLGFWDDQYTLPCFNEEEKIQDLRCYKLKQKCISTSGAKAGIFELNKMIKNKQAPVYICEGEWDTIAMNHLLVKSKIHGVAVCSPGATIFKEEWAQYFTNRKVYACFDNDQAGIRGQELILKRLSKTASQLRFIHWPEKKGIGYDIRDFYQDVFLKTKKPKQSMYKLLGLMRKSIKGYEEEPEHSDVEIVIPKVDTSIDLQAVEKSFNNKMFQPDMEVFKAISIALISTAFETKPIWLFIVAPPSAGKTEMIMSYKYFGAPYSELIHYTSSLTEHTLVSGMQARTDPSLLAQFNGKRRALFIKDFTPILSYPDSVKLEIFGTFRDSYDGSTSKDYGNGIKRVYNDLKFPIIAGVTPEIYKETAQFAALGERFGKIQLRGSDALFDVMKMMSLNMENIGKEVTIDDTHNKISFSFLSNVLNWIKKYKIQLPVIPQEFYSQLSYLSLYTSRMRGTISRDRFKNELIVSKPTKEKPMRFNLMIATIASYTPLLSFETTVTQESIDFARKIALDTVNPRDEEILRTVYKLNQEYIDTPTEFNRPNKRNIYKMCRYTPFTVDRVLQDLVMLDILSMSRTSRQTLYSVSQDLHEILIKGKIYQTEKELNRTSLIMEDVKPNYKKLKIKKS